MKRLTTFTNIVFIGLLTLSTGANAGLILDLANPCSTTTVTAGGADAGACLGLYEKFGNQSQATESGLNNSSALPEYNLAVSDGWGATGAFGRNNWDLIDLVEFDTISPEPDTNPFTWTIAPSLNGDYLFAIKQANSLGLWLFEDLVNVSGGTFFDIPGINQGWSNYRIFHSEEGGGPPPDIIEVPEPSVLLLLGSALLALNLRKKRY
jgi:hypothetical protein